MTLDSELAVTDQEGP